MRTSRKAKRKASQTAVATESSKSFRERRESYASSCADGRVLIGKLGHVSLIIIEKVFVTSENPVHGLVSALTVSIVIILQWLLLLLYL